jgi:hypothetical protein
VSRIHLTVENAAKQRREPFPRKWKRLEARAQPRSR